MAINLHTKYSDKIKQVYTHNSFIEGKTNQEYSFVGVRTVKIPNIITQDLNNYDRTASSNRYGNPKEVQDAIQELTVSQDKSFAMTIDKGYNTEQQMIKQAGKVMEAQMREKVTPYTDKHAVSAFAANAGKTLAYSAAVSKSNIVSMLLDIEVAFEDAFIPTDRRYVLVKNTDIPKIKTSAEFQYSDTAVKELLLKGVVGKIGTLNIIGVPASYMPTGVEHVAFQSNSVMLPFKIKDTNLHQDPPGLSGHLLEGRFLFDAFVLGPICDGVVVCVASGAACGTPSITVSSGTATIATATTGATVYYTTDGTDPRWSASRKSAVTSATATVATGDVIKAYATQPAAGKYASVMAIHIVT